MAGGPSRRAAPLLHVVRLVRRVAAWGVPGEGTPLPCPHLGLLTSVRAWPDLGLGPPDLGLSLTILIRPSRQH